MPGQTSKQPKPSCWDTALTQSAMTACAAADFQQAESAMQREYKKLLAKANAGNPSAAPKIEAAQRAWLAFRDAQLEAMFAADNKQLEYGSVYAMCRRIIEKNLTLERTKQLSAMMSSPPEGDVCIGDRY
ncbi:MAG: lysozyme inhibitor LprI family protein [Acidobacteriota bacterium]